jgi:hypothetical protein
MAMTALFPPVVRLHYERAAPYIGFVQTVRFFILLDTVLRPMPTLFCMTHFLFVCDIAYTRRVCMYL